MDESHQTIPQVRGMYHGDRSRKQTLVDFGFRLPSALDNRPLTFEEFDARIGQRIYVSATPAPWELERTAGVVVEQVIRPTGLLDPVIEVRPAQGQVDDLIGEVRKVVARKERVLVTTLTKRMAEELTQYLSELGIRVRYLHSDVETLERVEIVTGLRRGEFDVLVGINLLREGLDLPEVSLVAILDADKEGFLRSTTSLIQTAGRAARNLNGRAIFYADQMTDSMKRAIDETERRRASAAGVQRGARHRAADDPQGHPQPAGPDEQPRPLLGRPAAPLRGRRRPATCRSAERIARLEKEMRAAAKRLEFEEAAAPARPAQGAARAADLRGVRGHGPERLLSRATRPSASGSCRTGPASTSSRTPQGKVLYVGKAKSLRKRASSYLARDHEPRLAAMVDEAARPGVRGHRLRAGGAAPREQLDQAQAPALQRPAAGRQDLSLSQADHRATFPRIAFTRRIREDGADYFGPFLPGGLARKAIKLVQKLFQIRVCRIEIDGTPAAALPVLRHAPLPGSLRGRR